MFAKTFSLLHFFTFIFRWNGVAKDLARFAPTSALHLFSPVVFFIETFTLLVYCVVQIPLNIISHVSRNLYKTKKRVAYTFIIVLDPNIYALSTIGMHPGRIRSTDGEWVSAFIIIPLQQRYKRESILVCQLSLWLTVWEWNYQEHTQWVNIRNVRLTHYQKCFLWRMEL